MEAKKPDNSNSDAGQAGASGRGGSDLTIFPNIKYRPRNVPAALLTWLVIYFVPGVIAGRLADPAVGLTWMSAGMLFLAWFTWQCFFARRLVADRDGFQIERPARRKSSVSLRLGYGKLHEVRLLEAGAFWRHALGPLVFVEPIWPAQRSGRMKMVIRHAGPEVVLREDEIGRLEEFAELLRTKNVMGLQRPKTSAPPDFFRR